MADLDRPWQTLVLESKQSKWYPISSSGSQTGIQLVIVRVPMAQQLQEVVVRRTDLIDVQVAILATIYLHLLLIIINAGPIPAIVQTVMVPPDLLVPRMVIPNAPHVTADIN